MPYIHQQPHNPYPQTYAHPENNMVQSNYDSHQMNPPETGNPEIKTIEYEGWGDIEEPMQQQSAMNQKMDMNNLNNLGRFSPILTDEEN